MIDLLPLVWANLGRKKLRTIFTFLSILIAFFLFGYLSAVRHAFDAGIEVAGADRLLTTHKVSIIMPLPESYQARIERIPGVELVTHANWFGGVYQDPKNFFPQLPVDPERFLEVYPEIVLPAAEKKAWLETKSGVVVGKQIADRYHWKIGDRIPIQATVWRKADGSATWDFDLVGIYTGKTKATDTTQFLFRYDYFEDGVAERMRGLVGWYVVRVADPAHADRVAAAIDHEFENSSYETKTSTEKAFMQAFANQIGDVGAIITAVVSAVFFTILIVGGNTIAQAVRERTGELAVLKTLGFGRGRIVGLVLFEALALVGLAGAIGLGLSWLVVTAFGDPTHGALPVFYVSPRDLATGTGLIVALGLLAGTPPAWRALRLRIVDALRRA